MNMFTTNLFATFFIKITRGLVGFAKSKTSVIIILSLILIKISPSSVFAVVAPCDPFYTKIDFIENELSCLSAREFQCSTSIDILNHCDEEFYPSDDQGNINTQEVIINYDDYAKSDITKYQNIERSTGIKQTAVWFPPQPRLNLNPCTEGEKMIVSGVNICNKSDLEKLANNTVMKNWVVKLRSKDTNQDVIIHGRTLYRRNEDNLNLSTISNLITTIFLLTSIISFVIAVILLVIKSITKKKINVVFIIFLLLVGFIFYIIYLLPQYFLG